jgi:light-regulated signal transduction histidine kinase (bacteriophytochrome)
MQRLNAGDNLLVLKKPFDPIEVMQMARALCGKWETARRTAAEMLELECRNEELGRLARAADAFQACWSATQAATPRAEVDMAAVLRGVAGDLARTGEGRQAIVQADPLPKVAGHEPALTQVLRHLVDNAIKFVPADRVPAVRVGCSEAPVEWVFSVTDNGTGIAADLSDRIFTIAPRQHRHDDQERMGVGLAVCRSIVESYGGRIWVEPPAGGGATLCFAIPR